MRLILIATALVSTATLAHGQVPHPESLAGQAQALIYRQCSGRPLIVRPQWLRQPAPETVAGLAPRGQDRYRGRVMMKCLVDAEGGLNTCAVISESPAGHGFGRAALALTPEFKLKPGLEGYAVNVPVIFNAS